MGDDPMTVFLSSVSMLLRNVLQLKYILFVLSFQIGMRLKWRCKLSNVKLLPFITDVGLLGHSCCSRSLTASVNSADVHVTITTAELQRNYNTLEETCTCLLSLCLTTLLCHPLVSGDNRYCMWRVLLQMTTKRNKQNDATADNSGSWWKHSEKRKWSGSPALKWKCWDKLYAN